MTLWAFASGRTRRRESPGGQKTQQLLVAYKLTASTFNLRVCSTCWAAPQYELKEKGDVQPMVLQSHQCIINNSCPRFLILWQSMTQDVCRIRRSISVE